MKLIFFKVIRVQKNFNLLQFYIVQTYSFIIKLKNIKKVPVNTILTIYKYI